MRLAERLPEPVRYWAQFTPPTPIPQAPQTRRADPHGCVTDPTNPGIVDESTGTLISNSTAPIDSETGVKPVAIRGASLDGSEDLTLVLSSAELQEAVADYIVKRGLIPFAVCKNVRLTIRSGYTMVSVEEAGQAQEKNPRE
jgi:hypothetical protein